MSDLPDGIFVRLEDQQYFEADRLGSTDLTVLATRPADWFYMSRHNPHREREVSDEMLFGTALHALVLEGEDAYASRCIVRPDEYPDAKTGKPKPWHGAAGWCQDWLAQHAHLVVLSSDADRRVRHMAALIQNHPELGPVMRGGMPEVAILWTHDSGVKLRAKIDMLLPRYCLDLKSHSGDSKGLSLTQQVLSLVAQRNMDVQRALYFYGRQKMASLVEAGAVYGATDEELDWLKRVAAIEDWSWVWCFFRRRDDRRGYAPVVKPIIRSHFDTTFESGRRKVDVAIKNYQAFVERFGFETPWAVVEPAEEPADHAFPAWIQNVNDPVQFPAIEDEAA